MNKTSKGILLFGSLLLPVSVFAGSNTLYGDFRYSLNNIDTGDDSTLSGENNASRVGIKGDIGEAGGLTAFYHLQAGASVDTSASKDAINQRFFLAGIKGDFGKLVYGKTSTAYKMAGLKIDPFYDTSAGISLGGATFGLSRLTNGWSDNSLAYSRKIQEFSIDVGAYLDDSEEDEHDINLGFSYEDDSLSAGVQYLSIGDTGVVANSSADSSAIRVHGKYAVDSWSVAGSVESVDPSEGDKQRFIYLATTYQISDKMKLAGAYGLMEDVSATVDGSSISFGGFYQLLKKTTVYAVVSAMSADESDGEDRDTLAVGVSHKFSLM